MIRLADPDLREEDIAAVAEVLRSGFLVQGKRVAEFERRMAAYLGCRQAIAVSSGTAALHLAVLALDIGPGDEVLVPDFTWPATANVVELTGARAVAIDIDLATYNIDIAQVVERTATVRTKAIIPVHLFGLPADMEPLLDCARTNGWRVVEDAACAIGAEYRGRKCGTLGDVACFSFHPRKILTTGEGGMLTTDDDALADRLRSLRNHGVVQAAAGARFEHAGLNYRLTDFQAALGVSQLERLPAALAQRRRLVDVYQQELSRCPRLARPSCPADRVHVWQAYVVLLDEAVDRAAVQSKLRAAGIETTIGTYTLSAQPYYRDRVSPGPAAQQAFRQCLCLPLHTRLSEDDVRRVARQLTQVLGG